MSLPTEAPPVERQIVVDMLRRALPAAPVVVAVAWLVWGSDGAWSALYAVGLVLANFALAAALLSWSARISVHVLMATAMLSYVLRLGLIAVAVLAVKDKPWVDLVPLGLTLMVTHLGLLAWEAKHVSSTLAFPGLKPGDAR